jgi:predicted permease
VLLVGAGLFIRSLQHVRELPLGYDVDHIVYVEASMRGVELNSVEESRLPERLRDAASAVPGVLATTQVVSVPFYSGESRSVRVESIDSVRKLGRFQLQAGSPGYFQTTGTRILRGRAFDSRDTETHPQVVVVSESMAKALWRGADPIGKCIRISGDSVPCITVIGVAEDTRARNITGSGEFMYYLPISQYVAAFRGLPMLAMFVRVAGRSDDFTEAVRSRVQPVMPNPAFVTARPFHEIIDPTMRSWTSGARMFTTFGVLALLLAAIGLYAVVAFTVSQRTQELGIRIALGALPRDVLALVIGNGLRVTVIGVLLGSLSAFAAARALDGLLFGVSSRDPMIYAAVAATLVVVGVLASAVPGSRASRIDPNTALRTE